MVVCRTSEFMAPEATAWEGVTRVCHEIRLLLVPGRTADQTELARFATLRHVCFESSTFTCREVDVSAVGKVQQRSASVHVRVD